MGLPLLISVPHAGLRVPPEVDSNCALTPEQIIDDGDGGAAEIYALESHVEAFVTTDTARAIVDMNRAEDDRRADGVVKTHTCWNVPVYHAAPTSEVVAQLLARYYRPYHERLVAAAGSGVRVGIDCHTMAATGPPIGPDPGVERPWICLSDGNGTTCPRGWVDELARQLETSFDHTVSINKPFAGGYITRRHASEIPWMQLELSRSAFMSNGQKAECVLLALRAFCQAALA